MSAGNGWIGSLGQLLYTLRTFHAQEDEQGNIILTGEAPAVFMGIGEESSDVVVPAGCVCFIDGVRTNVCGLLGATSYGQKVTVVA